MTQLRGGAFIASAEYQIRGSGLFGDSSQCPMGYELCALDGAFNDDPVEDVQITLLPNILTPGVYETCVRGADANGNVGDYGCTFVVIYDPDAGFVTGGGWIQSASSNCSICEGASGRANFGFISKYKKGAHVPTGQTEFMFNAGALNFTSTEYEWLVISGSLAQYKGSGTINGDGDFAFLLTAKDSAMPGGGAADTFRLKIWRKDAAETIVYDNGTGRELGGGSIVIHAR